MSKEIGTLVVVVLKARNLRDKHTIHKQDVYAQATLNKTTKKTKTDVRGGQHPVWDEELRFPIFKAVSDESRKLEVACYSKEPRQDDLIGIGSVDISETLKTGEFDDWVPLKTEEGGYRGELFLEMTYYAAQPPLQRRASKWAPADRLKRPGSTYSYPAPAPEVNGTSSNGRSPSAQKDTLPPLPEEVPSVPSIPSILRPGGANSAKTSPKAGAGLLPPEHPAHTQAARRDPSPPAFIPATLRPGGGGAPPPTTTPVPLSNTPLPAPSHHSTLPGPKIPEPQIPTPEIPYGGSPPRQSYVEPPRPSYVEPPRQSYVEPPRPSYTEPPRQSYVEPPRQSYVEPPRPSYIEPPRPQAYNEYPHPAHRHTFGEYGSPPRHDYSPGYGVPPAPAPAAPPLFPPQPQVYHHHPPPPAASQPYGGYPSPSHIHHSPPPPQRGDFDLPDPYLQARYQTPLPLPDEPRVGRTQTPSRPFPQTQPQPVPTPAPAPAPDKAPREPSREERDRQVALELEKEEAERRRRLREQEERDMELARKLDLELNLEAEGGGAAS
ncbi:hypothetical protein C8Q76DRAFT_798886 [Earliella scabrosa]|nr:hypothetical protein C8Q76DRAFT_798886 [Earliella scabrosa]